MYSTFGPSMSNFLLVVLVKGVTFKSCSYTHSPPFILMLHEELDELQMGEFD